MPLQLPFNTSGKDGGMYDKPHFMMIISTNGFCDLNNFNSGKK